MNPPSVLVAYATKNESTAEIADHAGASRKAEGRRAEDCPVDQTRDLDGYHAVMLGRALDNRRRRPDAHRLDRRHATAVGGRQVRLCSSAALHAPADESETAPSPQAADAASAPASISPPVDG